MKTLRSIPRTERHHYMKCECGEYFDMRDLKDVMQHLHKSHELINAADYTHSIKVGEPHIHTKSKTKITIN